MIYIIWVVIIRPRDQNSFIILPENHAFITLSCSDLVRYLKLDLPKLL